MTKDIMKNDLLGLGNDMMAAAEEAMNLEQHGLKPFVKHEVEHLLQAMETIMDMERSGNIDEERAKALLNMQKDGFEVLLLTVKGIRKVEMENLINAVLDVLAGAAKRWWGLSL